LEGCADSKAPITDLAFNRHTASSQTLGRRSLRQSFISSSGKRFLPILVRESRPQETTLDSFFAKRSCRRATSSKLPPKLRSGLVSGSTTGSTRIRMTISGWIRPGTALVSKTSMLGSENSTSPGPLRGFSTGCRSGCLARRKGNVLRGAEAEKAAGIGSR
jgi:hypothetical protein